MHLATAGEAASASRMAVESQEVAMVSVAPEAEAREELVVQAAAARAVGSMLVVAQETAASVAAVAPEVAQ